MHILHDIGLRFQWIKKAILPLRVEMNMLFAGEWIIS